MGRSIAPHMGDGHEWTYMSQKLEIWKYRKFWGNIAYAYTRTG